MTILSTFVFVTVFISYSYQELIQEADVLKARADCQKETGISDELIDKAENGEFSNNKELKCFTKCFYAKLGYINDAGEPQLEFIKENIPEADREKAYKVLEKCKDTQGNPCERAYALHTCYFEQMRAE